MTEMSKHELINALERMAQYYSEGCFTIMKLREGWKCMLGTPNLVSTESRDYINNLRAHKNLEDAIKDRLYWLK